MKKIIVMPDSFKNTMDSNTVCSIIKKSLLEEEKTLNIKTYELADGGEGTALIFSKYLGLDIERIKTINAFGEEIEVIYGTDGKTAVIDIASVVGFDVNVNHELDPSKASTNGIGILMRKIMEAGHDKIYVGLGGSITNDLGLGMMSELGVKFYDEDNKIINPVGSNMGIIKTVDVKNQVQFNGEIICLSDVVSPLFGENGAAKMFARQKGASDEMIIRLEEDGKKVVKVINNVVEECSMYPGSGAAGGLGFSFKTFYNAEMKSGIDKILLFSGIREQVDADTIIITGEGKFDNQSMNGKVINGIVKIANEKKADVIVIAGYSEIEECEGIRKIISTIDEKKDFDYVKANCRENLYLATKKVYEYIKKRCI